MEMSIFLSLDFTEILHLKNTWLQFFIYILKLNNVLFEQLHLLEPSMWQYLFLINYKNSKHHKTARYSHIQRRALLWDQKQVFLPFKIK